MSAEAIVSGILTCGSVLAGVTVTSVLNRRDRREVWRREDRDRLYEQRLAAYMKFMESWRSMHRAIDTERGGPVLWALRDERDQYAISQGYDDDPEPELEPHHFAGLARLVDEISLLGPTPVWRAAQDAVDELWHLGFDQQALDADPEGGGAFARFWKASRAALGQE